MTDKEFKTIEDQLETLRSRDLTISDDEMPEQPIAPCFHLWYIINTMKGNRKRLTLEQ